MSWSFIFRRIRDKTNGSINKIRNMAYEKRVFKYSVLTTSTIFAMVFASALYFQNNSYYMTMNKDLAAFGVNENLEYKIDMKYNCSNCNHSLKQGDIIGFTKNIQVNEENENKDYHIVGMIVNTSGNMANITPIKQGRALASKESIKLKENEFAVHSPTLKKTILVTQKEIHGKYMLFKNQGKN